MEIDFSKPFTTVVLTFEMSDGYREFLTLNRERAIGFVAPGYADLPKIIKIDYWGIK